jgi:hypothetical protein
MHTGRAFVAGIAGALVMALITIGFSSAGLPLHVDARLASLLGSDVSAIGFVVRLVVGGALGLVYASIFEYVMHQSGIGVGMLLGACNTIIAGFVWAALGGPGAFWDLAGPYGVMVLFVSHLVYGGVVGGVYHSDQVPLYG